MTSSPYHLHRLLGEGGFGKVYLGYHQNFGFPVTVKVIPKTTITSEVQLNQVRREFYIPRLIPPHKNISTPLDGYEDQENIYIVSEYLDGGVPMSRWNLPEDVLILVQVMFQLADAYDWMEGVGVAHRDIKPENIIIVEERPIVVDFDLSCIEGSTEYRCYPVAGTPDYIAPEIWKREQTIDYFLADVYSLGVVFYYLANNRSHPYGMELSYYLRNGQLTQPPEESNSGYPELDDVIMGMLSEDPLDRPRFAEVRNQLQEIIKSL